MPDYRNSSLEDFVNAYEDQATIIDAAKDVQKEIVSGLKAAGYDASVFRKVIARRKRDRAEVAEEDAMIREFEEQLGMHASDHDDEPELGFK